MHFLALDVRVARMRKLSRRLLVPILFFCLLPTVQAALQVERAPSWGFDGKIRLQRFNLLTIELVNASETPWEGDLLIEPVVGLSGGDMPIVQPGMYVEPHGRRRVQFLLYTPQIQQYRLKWGRRVDETYLIDEPTAATDPAVVEFIPESSLTSLRSSYPRFIENDFPNSAAGLETLGGVLLNHVPAWNEAQQRAFRDWLWAGGRLELFQGADGQFPQFGSQLAELNDPTDLYHPGSGTVVRRHKSIQGEAPPRQPPGQSNSISYSEWSLPQTILSTLQSVTKPDHDWSAIFLLAIVYVLFLFPGCWLLGRKRGDYRIVVLAVLSVVALFSMAFRKIGARGYGEETAVDSVAIARMSADDRALVTQFSNLFVTEGDQYLVTHTQEGLTYSSGQQHESVLGRVLNRPRGSMFVDIPSFSGRTFVSCGVARDPLPRPTITAFSQIGTLLELQLEFPDNSLWKDDSAAKAILIHGNHVYSTTLSGKSFRFVTGGSTDLETAMETRLMHNAYYGRYYGSQNDERDLMWPLIAQDLGIDSDAERNTFELPDDQLVLYLWTRMPESFHVGGEQFPKQRGRVLHSWRLYPDGLQPPQPTPTKERDDDEAPPAPT
ncbi:hypothetical protein [Planctomicrobium sp. SH664]|uniref:hypothetical protein n=1 Tax=Planctomicrobium sp. SH664 TaxID=3448125 RepID=UPI003F5C0B05